MGCAVNQAASFEPGETVVWLAVSRRAAPLTAAVLIVAPSASTATNNRRAASAMAATPGSAPSTARNADSRIPIPPGTGRNKNPATHDVHVASVTVAHPWSSPSARPTSQVAVAMPTHASSWNTVMLIETPPFRNLHVHLAFRDATCDSEHETKHGGIDGQ